MYRRKCILWSVLLLSLLVLPSSAQTVIPIGSSGEPLMDRLESAVDRPSSGEHWIVFSFERTMCEGCMIGSLGGYTRDNLATIGELLTGESRPEESVQRAARRAIDQIEGAPDRFVRKRLAVILHMNSRTELMDVDSGTFDGIFDFGQRDILWLGSGSSEDALTLLSNTYDEDLPEDARKGLAWAIGNVPALESVLPVLTRIIDGSENEEVRKAAAYAIGGLDSASSVAALQRIIADDQSDEVRKAAIYGLGNSESTEARVALMKIINSLGSNR